MLKNVNATLSVLKECSSKAALEQRKIITSAIYDHMFGFPTVKETKTFKHEAKDLKTKLLNGSIDDLTPNQRKSYDYFPQPVKYIAKKCWRNNCTVVEPGKHTRPMAALKDGLEVISGIYQTMTDKEAYTMF